MRKSYVLCVLIFSLMVINFIFVDLRKNILNEGALNWLNEKVDLFPGVDIQKEFNVKGMRRSMYLTITLWHLYGVFGFFIAYFESNKKHLRLITLTISIYLLLKLLLWWYDYNQGLTFWHVVIPLLSIPATFIINGLKRK